MAEIEIDTRRNRVAVHVGVANDATLVHCFQRRWEALLLACLLDEARAARPLTAAAFQAAVQARGQSRPLNRAQLQRLLHNLRAFLDAHGALRARIEAPPRKLTVGPWQLLHPGDLRYRVDGHDPASAWPHPTLVPPDDVDALLRVLGTLLVADAFAVEGRCLPAIDMLHRLEDAELTPAGRGVKRLRLCGWYRKCGQFGEARAWAHKALSEPIKTDPGQALFARFMLDRIDYDENPADRWESLWRSTADMPTQPSGVSSVPGNWRTMTEWHNLRALLARRRMHSLAADARSTPAMAPAATPPVAPATTPPVAPRAASPDPAHRADAAMAHAHALGADHPQGMHRLALHHLQAALYLAIWFRDWDRLQAYVANLAYHLQSALGLGALIGVSAQQVLRWHRLTMAYEDKFGAGRDSAWEYIFFGAFWLDHQHRLEPTLLPDPLAHHLGNTTPAEAAFYERALVRLRECGDDRQVAIGHSLYLRFAREHLPREAAEPVIEHQTKALQRLLSLPRNAALVGSLVKEGYAEHWPDALQALTRPRRKP